MAKKKVPKEQTNSNPIIWGSLIFAAAFLIRLFYLIDFSSTPLANYLILDPRAYNDLAREIAAGNFFAGEIFFKAPLYPYFLALIYAIFDFSLFAARFVQIVLGSFSCVLIYLLAGRFYGKKIALTAGFVAAAYGPLIMFDSEILIPALIVFLDLMSIYLLFKYEDKGKLHLLIGSALLLGLSSLARPNILILLPGILIWLYRYCRKSRKRRSRDILVYLGGIVLMLALLIGRNYGATGEVVLFGNYGGYNFLIGNNAQSDGRTAVLPGTSPEFKQGYQDAVEIANRLSGRVLSEGELGYTWFRLGVDFVVKNPFKWLWLEVRKLGYLIGGFEIPNNRHIYYFASQSPVLRFLLWDKIVSFPFGILLPLALVAVFAKRVRKNQFLLSFFVISYSLTILIFFVTGRFRIPLMPVIIIWGAAGFWFLVELYRKTEFQQFYRLLALLFTALIVCNGLSYLPAFAVRPPNDYESHMFMGDAYHAAGEEARAERELLEAARLNPSSARVFNSLGNVLVSEGKDSLAIVYYKRGVEADPNYETVKKSLAATYKRLNKIGDLYEFVQDEKERNPKSSWALKDYAYIHVLLGEKDLAVGLYEQAFQADTTDYEALFRKAQLYLEMDMREDAEREYLRLLKYLPNSVEVHANLAQTYGRQMRLAEALKEFLWVQQHDADNPSAYFNLASVYLQMGQLDEAEEMVAKIKQLAPEFPTEDIEKLIRSKRQQ